MPKPPSFAEKSFDAATLDDFGEIQQRVFLYGSGASGLWEFLPDGRVDECNKPKFKSSIMPNLDLVIFDIAGTLIQDTGFVFTAFRAALQETGGTISAEQLQQWRGASKREVLQARLVPHADESVEALTARLQRSEEAFRASLQASLAQSGVRLIAGVEETFTWLRAHKIRIALNTGFDRTVMETIMHAAGWNENVIDAAVCSDNVAHGRPAPYMIFHAMEATGVYDVRRVMAIGDTVNDLLSGHNAGVRGVIGVLTGSHNREQLSQAPHTHTVGSVAALPELIEREFV